MIIYLNGKTWIYIPESMAPFKFWLQVPNSIINVHNQRICVPRSSALPGNMHFVNIHMFSPKYQNKLVFIRGRCKELTLGSGKILRVKSGCKSS